MERGNISANVNLQISPNGLRSVNDLHSTYLKFDVEREFVFTIETIVNGVTTVFFQDKRTASFLSKHVFPVMIH